MSLLGWIQTIWHSDSVPERIFEILNKLILKKSADHKKKTRKFTQLTKKLMYTIMLFFSPCIHIESKVLEVTMAAITGPLACVVSRKALIHR